MLWEQVKIDITFFLLLIKSSVHARMHTFRCYSHERVGHSHRFSGLCTRDSSAKFYCTHGRQSTNPRYCTYVSQRGDFLCSWWAPRSSCRTVQSRTFESQFSVLRSHGGHKLLFPSLHSSAEKKKGRTSCSRRLNAEEKHPQGPKRQRLGNAQLRWEEIYITVPGTTKALSRVASVELGSQAGGRVGLSKWLMNSFFRRTNRQSFNKARLHVHEDAQASSISWSITIGSAAAGRDHVSSSFARTSHGFNAVFT